MEFSFTIQDLCAQLSKSKQSIYQTFNRNSQFVKNNSIRVNRKIYYNQAVLDYLTDYYTHGAPIEAENKPIESPLREDGGEAAQERIAALEAKIAALEAELKAKEEERLEMVKQNGALLLLLTQEKQEKQLLLPAPKKSIGARLRAVFGKQNE